MGNNDIENPWKSKTLKYLDSTKLISKSYNQRPWIWVINEKLASLQICANKQFGCIFVVLTALPTKRSQTLNTRYWLCYLSSIHINALIIFQFIGSFNYPGSDILMVG